MSKIEIKGDTKFSKELISEQLDTLVKDRLHLIKKQIKEVEQDLNYFRKKYKMSDSEFIEKFEAGELGDDEDFFIWKGSIKVLSGLNEEQAILQDVI